MCFAIFKLLFYSQVVRFEIASGCIVTEIKNMESKPVTCVNCKDFIVFCNH